jgi:hypothetical protein
MENSSGEYGTKQARSSFSWGAVIGIVGFIAFLIVMIMIFRDVEANKGPCDDLVNRQRECALTRIVEEVLRKEPNENRINYLLLAQEEYLREVQGLITKDSEFQIESVPFNTDLDTWIKVRKNEYHYDSQNMVVIISADVFEVRANGKLIAELRGPLFHVYTSEEDLAGSSVVRHCQGISVTIETVEQAFECPIIWVTVQDFGTSDGMIRERVYSENGLVRSGWQSVRRPDLVLPNERE